MATLIDVEEIVGNRYAALLAQARALAGDEFTPSIEQATAWAIRALGYPLASPRYATAAELAAVADGHLDALLDLVELRMLESIQTGFTAVTVKAGPVSEDFNHLADRLDKIVSEKRANVHAAAWALVDRCADKQRAQAGDAEGGMSLHLLATETASIKRAAITAGRRAAPVVVLDGLCCTPLYPADAGAANNLLMRLKSETPYRILETFVLGQPDIQGGDTLVVGGEEYTVRAVAEWALPGTSRRFTHLMVEELPSP